jgi:hypothetical protein
LRSPNQPSPLVPPSQDQLQHHVVGQQDVRRLAGDAPAIVLGLLAGVPGKAHRGLASGITALEELLHLMHLAVGQGVHGVHHDRLNARPVLAASLGPQDTIHNRDQISQALPGSGTGGQDVTASSPGYLDRVPLMLVQPEHGSLIDAAGLGLKPKDPRALGMQQTFPTRSSMDPPGAKFGFRDSHGSGHW